MGYPKYFALNSCRKCDLFPSTHFSNVQIPVSKLIVREGRVNNDTTNNINIYVAFYDPLLTSKTSTYNGKNKYLIIGEFKPDSFQPDQA